MVIVPRTLATEEMGDLTPVNLGGGGLLRQMWLTRPALLCLLKASRESLAFCSSRLLLGGSHWCGHVCVYVCACVHVCKTLLVHVGTHLCVCVGICVWSHAELCHGGPLLSFCSATVEPCPWSHPCTALGGWRNELDLRRTRWEGTCVSPEGCELSCPTRSRATLDPTSVL